MNDSMRHFLGVAIAVIGFLIGIVIMFAAGWRTPKFAGTRLGMAMSALFSFGQAAGRWRRSRAAGEDPGKLGSAGMLAAAIATAVAAVALQRTGLVLFDGRFVGDGRKPGFVMGIFRDMVMVGLSPGVLCGLAIGLYARRIIRRAVSQLGLSGSSLHDAVMVPATLCLAAATAAAATASLAAAANIPGWLAGKPLPGLHVQAERMLFNLASGMLVVVVCIWERSGGGIFNRLSGLFWTWWGVKFGLGFALPFMGKATQGIVGRHLAGTIQEHIPNLVWIGIYGSVVLGAWLKTEGRSTMLMQEGVAGPPETPPKA